MHFKITVLIKKNHQYLHQVLIYLFPYILGFVYELDDPILKQKNG